MDIDDLSERQQLVIDRMSSPGSPLELLRENFNDPAEVFIVSPVPLTMRQLAHLYMDEVPEEDRHRFPAELRRRSRDERWTEQRAVFQSRRLAVRKDALLDAEGQVWAILGVEFHAKQIRSLMERWEALDAYIITELEYCESGERQFGGALRDACKAIGDIEEHLRDIMPNLAIDERAQRFWSSKGGDRDEIIQRIQGQLASVAGAGRAESVFQLIEGGGSDDDR